MIDDLDPVEFAKSEFRRARKEHTCEECSRVIRIGERYRYCFMLADGDNYQFAACEHCIVAQEWLTRECGGYVWAYLWEEIAEHIREYPQFTFPLGRLLIARRRGWRNRQQQGLVPVPQVPVASIASVVQA